MRPTKIENNKTMTVIENRNFCGMPDNQIPVADEYRGCNFSTREPLEVDGEKRGHPLNLAARFVGCNLTNRKPHPDAVIIGGNTSVCTLTQYGEDGEVTHPAVIHGQYDRETKEFVAHEAD